jgi:hypothetical protein
LGKCDPPILLGEEMANASSEHTGFVHYKQPFSGLYWIYFFIFGTSATELAIGTLLVKGQWSRFENGVNSELKANVILEDEKGQIKVASCWSHNWHPATCAWFECG